MKTNSKEVRSQIRKHIIDCVYSYKEEQFQTIKDAANHLYNEFVRVANHPHNLRRIPNEQKRFSDYLMGLPFRFNYSNHDISNYLNSLGINPSGKEYDSEKSIELYHYLIFAETIKNK
jgi:hypothetical protein